MICRYAHFAYACIVTKMIRGLGQYASRIYYSRIIPHSCVYSRKGGLSSEVCAVYTKPTDSDNYLYYDSAHPQRCKDSILYSQFLKIRRLYTHNSAFDKNIIELCKHFLRRKYPLKLLHQAALLARGLVRQDRTDTTTVE